MTLNLQTAFRQRFLLICKVTVFYVQPKNILYYANAALLFTILFLSLRSCGIFGTYSEDGLINKIMHGAYFDKEKAVLFQIRFDIF